MKSELAGGNSFVPGRGPQLKDVFIDESGSAIGITFCGMPGICGCGIEKIAWERY